MPTLLLSDDNATVQRMIALIFAAENIIVTIATDGEQAVARIAAERPDIVLAGIATPKRSGYDVAAFVKSEPSLASIPVLLLAGAFDPVDRVRAAQVRCDGVLVKPLEPQHVVARVKELIAGTARSAGLAAPVPRPAEGLNAAGRRPAPADSAPTVTGASGGRATLDEYFEQLDAAFAHRPVPVTPSRSPDSGIVPTLDAVLQAPPPALPSTGREPVSEATVDEVTRRVIERLGATALRDVVTDVVSEIAERLIREEIARIRSK